MTEDDPETPRDAIIEAVEALFLDDERWRSNPAPGCTVVSRGWPDGTLILLSQASAYGVREDPQGRRPWSMGPAPVEQIVGHARKLLPPDDPNAPKALRSDQPEGGADPLPRGEGR